jgi:polysaccharide export outer membrane protein
MRAAPISVLILFAATLFAGDGPLQQPGGADRPEAYVLGPEDQVVIRVLDIDEIPDRPFRIDARGDLNIPVAGRLHPAGLTVAQFEEELVRRFGSVLRNPTVNVFVATFRDHPVSVLGAVRNPGVHQIRGSKTLYEVLSLAGGLNPDAGSSIKITRRRSSGVIPLTGIRTDDSGEYQVAEVSVKSVMDAQNPSENIPVLPEDVITVPKADLVYVIGAVRRSGGFVLSAKEKMSVLQALSLAEGLERMAASQDARILRIAGGSETREEIPVNLKQILAGKSGDVSMIANDVLFVPISGAKSAFGRGLEAALQIGTGVAIYRH